MQLRRYIASEASQKSAEHISSASIQCEDDLARIIYEFAADAIVAKELVDFALPHAKRASAIIVIENAQEATPEVPLASPSSGSASAPSTKKRLRRNDDGEESSKQVRLSKNAAQIIAHSFFKFVERERLQKHLMPMHAGQIVVLSILHSRLVWRKGQVIPLKDSDHYYLQKPRYVAASEVADSSRAYFR